MTEPIKERQSQDFGEWERERDEISLPIRMFLANSTCCIFLLEKFCFISFTHARFGVDPLFCEASHRKNFLFAGNQQRKKFTITYGKNNTKNKFVRVLLRAADDNSPSLF